MSIISPYRSVSTEALCVLCGVPPLELELATKAQKFGVLNRNLTFNLDDEEIKESDVTRRIYTFDFPSYRQLHNIQIMVPKKNLILHTEKLYIFTDGSRMHEGTAAAFTVYYNNVFIFDYKIRLRPRNSIYQAELTAINFALDWFLDYL